MKTEFRKAVVPREIRALLAFDRAIFGAADRFEARHWRELETYWMLVDGVKAGCCAFHHTGSRTLYIATTGILPRFQGFGLGGLLKAWEIAYARYHGFASHTRKKNTRMMKLNQKFGFRAVRTIRGYYSDPPDSGVLMELALARKR